MLRGLSRLSSRNVRAVADQTNFCDYAILGPYAYSTFDIVICDISMTIFDEGELTVLGYGE